MSDIRLQKYMAQCGIASRRKCEQIILDGRVKINDEVIDKLGCKVNPLLDVVYVDDKVINLESDKIYILLNKPVGYISSVSDPQSRPTVIDFVKDFKERLYPVGRLDYNTSGLLILTNDGEFTNAVTHPRHNLKKTYIIKAKGKIDDDKIHKLRTGIDIGGYITAPADVVKIKQTNNYFKLEIGISEGKNRQIRRMLDAVGYNDIELKRVAIGNIKIGDLKLGNWRKLTDKEINALKENLCIKKMY